MHAAQYPEQGDGDEQGRQPRVPGEANDVSFGDLATKCLIVTGFRL